MSLVPATCYMIAVINGEAAGSFVERISPASASDIAQAKIVSGEFSTDIEGIHYMDKASKKLARITGLNSSKVREEYNPLYLPGEKKQLQELILDDPETGALEIDGLDGSPYTIKLIDIKRGSDEVQVKLKYQPFNLLDYLDSIEEHVGKSIN